MRACCDVKPFHALALNGSLSQDAGDIEELDLDDDGDLDLDGDACAPKTRTNRSESAARSAAAEVERAIGLATDALAEANAAKEAFLRTKKEGEYLAKAEAQVGCRAYHDARCAIGNPKR